MKTEKNFSVKPLIAAIALAGASAHIQAQPGISVGAGFNASASASMTSAFPALDVNHAVNTGYSTTVDVAFPSDTSSVDSLINEVRSGSGDSEGLPGLTETSDNSGQDTPDMEGDASLITDTASEATGSLQGGSDGARVEALVASATSVSSEISGKLQESEKPAPQEDNESLNSEESEETSETSAEESDASDEIADNSKEQPSLPDPSQQWGDTPNVEASGSVVSDATANATAQVTGLGDSGSSFDAMASSAFSSAYELAANLMGTQPEQPALPVSEGDIPDGSDQMADGSDQQPSLPAPSQNKPELPNVEVSGSVVSDIVADASARMSGVGESGPGFEAVVSGASSTAAELTASLQNSQPETPSQGENSAEPTEEQASNAQDKADGTAEQVSDAAESQPEPGSNAPEAGDVELAAAAESHNEADAFAAIY